MRWDKVCQLEKDKTIHGHSFFVPRSATILKTHAKYNQQSIHPSSWRLPESAFKMRPWQCTKWLANDMHACHDHSFHGTAWAVRDNKWDHLMTSTTEEYQISERIAGSLHQIMPIWSTIWSKNQINYMYQDFHFNMVFLSINKWERELTWLPSLWA